jgi:acetyl/propionyl-CoA carboxylase alpha subunit
MQRTIQRVLVVCRGEAGAGVARRIEAAGLEACAVYTDADAADAWLDEISYAARIAGEGDQGYLDGLAVVGAGLDGGCDALHPGLSPIATSAVHAHMAMNVGLAWLGSAPAGLEACETRTAVRRRARELGLPVVASSPPIETAEELATWLGRIGAPARVTSVVRGRAALAPDGVLSWEDARAALGPEPLLVERWLKSARHVVVGFLADAEGNVLLLGDHQHMVTEPGRVRVREAPAPALDALARTRLQESLPPLLTALGVTGLGAVELLVDEDGRWWLHDVRPALFDGYGLHEAVYGIDLVHTQIRLAAGETLGWQQADISPAGVGLEVVLCAVGAGRIDRLELPADASSSVVEGAEVDPARDPILARFIVTGPMRAPAIVRASALLGEVQVEGVAHDTATLQSALGDLRVWRGLSRPLLTEAP